MNKKLLIITIGLLILIPQIPLLPAARDDVLLDSTNPTPATFTIIVMPDTQVYAALHPALFLSQTHWILTHHNSLHIAYVTQEGDLVNNHNNTLQWLCASLAMRLLENPIATHNPSGIPYSVLPGNHDKPTTNYNHFFGPRRFTNKNYYGGHDDHTNNASYTLFTASGMDFIAISLEYNPTNTELAWTDQLLQTYSDRRAILTSHDLLDLNATWDPPGQRIYDTVKDHPNLFLMLCGHNHGETQRTDTYNTTTITTILADYQDYPRGGEGYLRILHFIPDQNIINVTTYSPALNRYETDNNSQFTIPYTMTST
jgi:hypothetical protein